MGVEYSALAAKLKAMSARLLTDRSYEELLEKKRVRDIFAYLKATDGYRESFSGVDEENIHRGAMELLLYQNMMDEFVRLYSFVDKSKRDIISLWFAKYEIEFLKREIRYIYTHEERLTDEVNQSKFEAFFATHTKINREIMLNAASLSDCVEACKNTPYGEILQRADNLNADFFSLGMLLDAYYCTNIWRRAQRILKGEQKKIFEKLIGTKIDMLNILWIYRGKKYYNFRNELVFTYLLPVRYRLSGETMVMLVGMDSADSFVDAVKAHTVYGGLFDKMEEGRFPEENFRTINNRLSKQIFTNNSESIAAVFAYLSLKETEISNITSITECVRYGLDADAISRHIGI